MSAEDRQHLEAEAEGASEEEIKDLLAQVQGILAEGEAEPADGDEDADADEVAEHFVRDHADDPDAPTPPASPGGAGGGDDGSARRQREEPPAAMLQEWEGVLEQVAAADREHLQVRLLAAAAVSGYTSDASK